MDEKEQLLRGPTGRLSVVLATGWLGIMLARSVIPPLLPSIVDGLAISESQAGFAMTIMWGVYALLHFPAGRLSDQLTRRTVLTTSMAVTILGILGLTRVRTYWLFVSLVGLIGVGAGLYFVPARAMLSDVFVSRRGAALGVQSAAGTLGSAGAGGLAIVALAIGPWQSAFPPILVILLVVGVLLQRFVDEPVVLSRVRFETVRTGRRILADRETRIVLVVYILFSFIWTGIVTFLPSFLQTSKELSPFVATTGYSLVFVVATVIGPLSGNLGDRISRARVAAGALFLGFVGITVLLVGSGTRVVMVGIVVLAAGFRSFPPVMQSYLLSAVDDDSTGADFGAFKSVYTGIGSLGTTYVGAVTDVMNYQVAFWGFVPLTLFGFVLVVNYLCR